MNIKLRPEGEEIKPKQKSNSEIMAERMKEIHEASRYNAQLGRSKLVFNENNYSVFDMDRVRPITVQPAPELKDTAIAHPYVEPPKRVAARPG